MEYFQQEFSVRFAYKVFFTTHLFDPKNALFTDFLEENHRSGVSHKIMFVIDDGVLKNHPYLPQQIKRYFSGQPSLRLIEELIVLPGGEDAKNDEALLYQIIEAVNKYGI